MCACGGKCGKLCWSGPSVVEAVRWQDAGGDFAWSDALGKDAVSTRIQFSSTRLARCRARRHARGMMRAALHRGILAVGTLSIALTACLDPRGKGASADIVEFNETRRSIDWYLIELQRVRRPSHGRESLWISRNLAQRSWLAPRFTLEVRRWAR